MIIGGGGHAKVVVSVVKKLGWRILGYTDVVDRGVLLGVPYLGTDTAMDGLRFAEPHCGALLGVGKVDASATRRRLLEKVIAQGFEVPVVVSPHAVVNEAVALGAGSVVCDGVVVNSGTVVGSVCILNTHATVEHDCLLGDNVHVAPGAVLSGGVRVGADTMIGAGATVIQNVTVCAGCLIGAGSVVTGDITEPGVYVGAPARRAG